MLENPYPGMRVIVIDGPDKYEGYDPPRGSVGTWLGYTDGVSFDTFTHGHSCDGHCERPHGWYIDDCHLAPYYDDDDVTAPDDSELMSLIFG